MENLSSYLAILALIVIGFLVVKKVASCMIKSVVTIVLIVAAVAIYWLYIK
ncbi:MAG: sulfate transporter [Prevotella sp.]|nr:sulfate transporter [Prevotella sp.]